MAEITVKPKIAVSSCLLGEEVRYDGGHKNNRYVSRVLVDYFDFVPLCPEVAIGLGIPRPTIRLVQEGDEVRARSHADSADDYTEVLAGYGRKMAASLTRVSGYILKKDSPSCGMERVKVYPPEPARPPEKNGVGIYAGVILEALPNLPVEEEGRLTDPRLRENFIERVFLYASWQALLARGLTPKGLVEFHTVHKFAILAHDETVYRQLGQIVARAGSVPIEECAESYIALLMQGMKTLTTPKKHANVLMHIMGFFKEDLEKDDKAELLRLIEAHREGLVPVIVPITLINYFRKKYPNEYIEGQTYLEPHPPELMLRNTL